jgi:hypothetical protein
MRLRTFYAAGILGSIAQLHVRHTMAKLAIR